mgnify:FL=1
MQLHFNPHHPEGGDEAIGHEVPTVGISIHTTPKVVTNFHLIKRSDIFISIHTTPKVVTRDKAVLQKQQMISIHTTPKVVTQAIADTV